MESDEEILTEVKDNIGYVVLNRPEKKNALNSSMRKKLRKTLQTIQEEANIKVVVIRGAGGSFCSGQDLEEFVDKQQDNAELVGEVLREEYLPLIQVLRDLKKPTVAAIEGAAVGAGLSLALACDLRLCNSSARFIAGFSRVGFVPDAGASWFLPRIIGLGRAIQMFFSSSPLDASTALSWGLVNEVFEDSSFDHHVKVYAENISYASPTTLWLSRKAVNYSLEEWLTDAINYESYLQEAAVHMGMPKEGITAFLEKRGPQYKE